MALDTVGATLGVGVALASVVEEGGEALLGAVPVDLAFAAQVEYLADLASERSISNVPKPAAW